MKMLRGDVKRWLIPAIVVVMLFLSSCTRDAQQKPVFTEGRHQRNEDYNATFDYLYADTDDLFFAVDPKLYALEEAEAAYHRVIEDMNVIGRDFQRSGKKPNVFILSQVVDRGSYLSNKKLFSAKADFDSGAYRAALVQACTGVTEPWMAYGIAGYLFDEKVDEAELAAYYNSADNVDILGLFGARFYPNWNTDEEIQVAKSTAVAFTSFFIAQYGAEAILQGITAKDKRDWLDSIGVNRAYEYAYDGLLDGFSYSGASLPLVITTEDAQYAFAPTGNMPLETASDIESFLYQNRDGRAYIIAYLRENAPNHYPELASNAAARVNYTFVQKTVTQNTGITDFDAREIKLREHFYNLHEAMHILIPSGDAGGWQFEGMAEYLSGIVYPDNAYIKLELDLHLSATGSYAPFRAFLHEFSRGGDAPDARAYFDALAAFVMLYPQKMQNMPSCNTRSIALRCGYSPNVAGNDLTYEQAGSFIAYLVDTYSLDAVLSYCRVGIKFDAVFGISYTQAKEDWVSSLMSVVDQINGVRGA